jgi:hypothetical protein
VAGHCGIVVREGWREECLYRWAGGVSRCGRSEGGGGEGERVVGYAEMGGGMNAGNRDEETECENT